MNLKLFATPGPTLFRHGRLGGAAFSLLVWWLLCPPAARGQATEVFSYTNSAPITINENDVDSSPYYPMPLSVNLPSTNLSRVTVSIFGLSDPGGNAVGSGGGVDILLAGPDVTNPTVNLMVFAGIPGEAVTNVNLTFDDNATGTFTSSLPVTNGTYRPSGYDTGANPAQTTNKLAGFIGTPLDGTWGLYVLYDDYNGTGSISNGWSLNFYMTVAPPLATTLAATNVGATNATLNANINTGGGTTTVYFEWGANTNYGNLTAADTLTNNLNSAQFVTAALTGLAPGTTNHFQAVAVNAAGTNYGGDLVLVTPNLAVAPPTLTEFWSNGVPVLELGGAVGSTYLIQFATSLNTPVTWTALTNVTLAGPVVYIVSGSKPLKAEFFRAVGGLSGVPAPSLTASLSNGKPALALSGSVNYNYSIQFSTNLASAAGWTTFTNVILTNSPQVIAPLPATAKAEFFRAVVP